MRLLTSMLIVLVVMATLGVSTATGQERPDRPLRYMEISQGQAYCPTSRLFVGAIVIASGRCYALLLVRDDRGLFLGFGAPGVIIPPGQIVRLSTPAGAKAKDRISYWVPLQTTLAPLPINTIKAVGARVQMTGAQVVLVLTGVAVPNLTLVLKTDYTN